MENSQKIHNCSIPVSYTHLLLICSSREGCLPANLQGIWNVYDSSPWSAGYWHNINVQMNYWPAFNTNLAEMFESYAEDVYKRQCKYSDQNSF